MIIGGAAMVTLGGLWRGLTAMSMVGGDLCVGDCLDPFEQGGCLSHCGDQVRTDAGSNTLALGSVRESV